MPHLFTAILDPRIKTSLINRRVIDNIHVRDTIERRFIDRYNDVYAPIRV